MNVHTTGRPSGEIRAQIDLGTATTDTDRRSAATEAAGRQFDAVAR